MAEKEPTLEQMVTELTNVGWVRKNFSFWTAPDGRLFFGPYGAWKVMTGRGTSPEFGERIVMRRP